MFLFHGSSRAFVLPKIVASLHALDFGAAFYTTSSQRQAERWARLAVRRRNSGVATVSTYEFDEAGMGDLLVREFQGPTREWLHFVAENRGNVYRGVKYDLVIGPIPNDRAVAVICSYMAGDIDDEAALKLLKGQKLDDQFAFLTCRALAHLHFVKEGIVEQ